MDYRLIASILAQQPIKVDHVQTVDILQDFSVPTEKAVPALSPGNSHAAASSKFPYPLRKTDAEATRKLAQIVATGHAYMNEPLADLRIHLIGYHPTKAPYSKTLGRYWGYAKGPINVRESSDDSDEITLTLQPVAAAAAAEVTDRRALEAKTAINALFPGLATPLQLTGGQISMIGQLLNIKNNPTRYITRLAVMYLTCALVELVGKTATATLRYAPSPAHIKYASDFATQLDATAPTRSWAPIKLSNISAAPTHIMLPIWLATSAKYPINTGGVNLPSVAGLWPEIPSLRLMIIGEEMPPVLDISITAEQVWDAAMEWCGQNASQAAFARVVDDLLLLTMAPTAPTVAGTNYVTGIAPFFGHAGTSIGLPPAVMAQYYLAPLCTKVRDWEESSNVRIPPPKIEELLHKAAGDALLWSLGTRMVGMTAQLTALAYDSSASVTAPLLQSMSSQRGIAPFNLAACQMVAAFMGVSAGEVTLSPMLQRIRPSMVTTQWVATWWDNQRYAPQWSEVIDVCRTLPPNATILPILRPTAPDMASVTKGANGIWHKPRMTQPTHFHIIEGLSMLAIHAPRLQLGVYTYNRQNLHSSVRPFLPLQTWDKMPSDWQFFGPMVKGSTTIQIVAKWDSAIDVLAVISECNAAAEYRLKIQSREDAAEYFQGSEDPMDYNPPPPSGPALPPGTPYGTTLTGIYKPEPDTSRAGTPPHMPGPGAPPGPGGGSPQQGPNAPPNPNNNNSQAQSSNAPASNTQPGAQPGGPDESNWATSEQIPPNLVTRIRPLVDMLDLALKKDAPQDPRDKEALKSLATIRTSFDELANKITKGDTPDVAGIYTELQALAFTLPTKFLMWHNILAAIPFDSRHRFMSTLGEVLRALTSFANTPVHAMALGVEATRCAARAAALTACPAITVDELVAYHKQSTAAGEVRSVTSANEMAAALHEQRLKRITPIAVQRALIVGMPITSLLAVPVKASVKTAGGTKIHNTAASWMEGDDTHPDNQEIVDPWKVEIGSRLTNFEDRTQQIDAVVRARAAWLSKAKSLHASGIPHTWEHAVAILGLTLASQNAGLFLDAPHPRVLQLIGRSRREVEEAVKTADMQAAIPGITADMVPTAASLRLQGQVTFNKLLDEIREADADYQAAAAARYEAYVRSRQPQPPSPKIEEIPAEDVQLDIVTESPGGDKPQAAPAKPKKDIHFVIQQEGPQPPWGTLPRGSWLTTTYAEAEDRALGPFKYARTPDDTIRAGPADPLLTAALPNIGPGGRNMEIAEEVIEVIARRATSARTASAPADKKETTLPLDFNLPTFYYKGDLYEFHPGMDSDADEDDGVWMRFSHTDVVSELASGNVWRWDPEQQTLPEYKSVRDYARKSIAAVQAELQTPPRPTPPVLKPTPTPELDPVANPRINTMTGDVGQNTADASGAQTVLGGDAPEADLGLQLAYIDPKSWELVQSATQDVLSAYVPRDALRDGHIAQSNATAMRQLARAALYTEGCLKHAADHLNLITTFINDHSEAGIARLSDTSILDVLSPAMDNLAGAAAALSLIAGTQRYESTSTVRNQAYRSFDPTRYGPYTTMAAELDRANQAFTNAQVALVAKYVLTTGRSPAALPLMSLNRQLGSLPFEAPALKAIAKDLGYSEQNLPRTWQESMVELGKNTAMYETYAAGTLLRLEAMGVLRGATTTKGQFVAVPTTTIANATNPLDAVYTAIVDHSYSAGQPLFILSDVVSPTVKLPIAEPQPYLFSYLRSAGLTYQYLAPEPPRAPPNTAAPPLTPEVPPTAPPTTSPPQPVPVTPTRSRSPPASSSKKTSRHRSKTPIPPQSDRATSLAALSAPEETPPTQSPATITLTQAELPTLNITSVRTPASGAESQL